VGPVIHDYIRGLRIAPKDFVVLSPDCTYRGRREDRQLIITAEFFGDTKISGVKSGGRDGSTWDTITYDRKRTEFLKSHCAAPV
jgi:hypothetical protein